MSDNSTELQTEIRHVTVYNPNQIINLFSDQLARKSKGEVNVRGIFQKGNGRAYSGFYYDSLKDEKSPYVITIKISAELRQSLDNGNLIDVTGVIDRKVKENCTVELQVNVTNIAVVQEQTISEDQLKRIEIRKRKSEMGYKTVDVLLENAIFADKRPRVALVFADSSITDSDFNAAKDAAAVQIDFEEYRVSFAKSQEFAAMLTELDGKGFDAICIVRGGGSGLDTLENLQLLECISGMSTAVVTAVGHVEDNPFIEEIADKKLGTPSLLGQYFKDLVETVSKKKADSTAALSKKIELQFKEQIENAKKQNADLQKKLDDLTKASKEATAKHDEQVKTAQQQNTELQKKLTELTTSSAEAAKKHDEQVKNAQQQNTELQKKLTELTTSSAEAAKKHDEQVKNAQEQNKQLQEQIKKLTETSAEAQKISKEQNDALQNQLKEITQSSTKQAADFASQVQSMNDTISRQNEEISKYKMEIANAPKGISKAWIYVMGAAIVILLVWLLLKMMP